MKERAHYRSVKKTLNVAATEEAAPHFNHTVRRDGFP